jgi:transposase InsO family protein
MAEKPTVRKEDVVTWPRPVRQAIDAIAVALGAVLMLVRARAAESLSPLVRAFADRDVIFQDRELLRREADILRSRDADTPPQRRSHYPPESRLAILQLMRLRHWTVEQTAKRFALHTNTIRHWLKEFNQSPTAPLFTGAAPFNKLSQAAQWLVHEVRALCPEPEFGTRQIAARIVRAGIKLSRSSAQRILRKPKPPKPPAPAKAAPLEQKSEAAVPYHILRPTKPNRTWHLDLATIDILWMRFYVAALLDGYSRKLLGLSVYRNAPKTSNMLVLFRAAVRRFGKPRFLVTDHGTQFRSRFRQAVKRMKVALVKGRVRSCQFNGKAERFFKTFRIWQRVTLFAWPTRSIQRKLDIYRDWYNQERSIFGFGCRTPDELWAGADSPVRAAMPIRENDPVKPALDVRRIAYRGDPNLIQLDIQIVRSVKRSA